MTIQLRPELPTDALEIEAVTVAAFEHAPHTAHTEQFIVRALRTRGQLAISIVAVEEGQIVGHVAVSPVTIGGQAGPWYGLGPISVAPRRQGRGIGTRLVERALAELRGRQAGGCVVLGDPAYYMRFGFKVEAGLVLADVPPEYFMAIALAGAVPAGAVRYSEAFNATA